jgi:hypothetical protein
MLIDLFGCLVFGIVEGVVAIAFALDIHREWLNWLAVSRVVSDGQVEDKVSWRE